MNRFFFVFILIFATASNADAKNCKKGKPCGNSCISIDKECRIGFGSPSSLSPRSSERGSSSSSLRSTIDTKNCKEGKLCGDSCISIDKECHVGDISSSYPSPISSGSDSSSSASNSPSQNSSGSNSSYTSYPSPRKAQATFEGNGVIVTDSEVKKDNSAPSADRKDDKELVVESGDKKNTTNSPKTTTAVVSDILDADIFQFSGKKKQKIKLYGIDAPEDGQPFYQEAKNMLNKLIHKKNITAKIYSQDSDETGMAVVFANGKNVNELLVKSGAVWVRRDLCAEAFCDSWIESEEEAKSQGKGLWSDSGRIPPWVWK